MKKRIVFYLKAAFLLPGTFLHELSHYVVAKALGARTVGFSLLPTMEENAATGEIAYKYGHVSFIPKIKVFNIFIGLSPLILWFLAYQAATQIDTIFADTGKGLYPKVAITLYAFVVLVISGKPSSVDIKLALDGLVSKSALIGILLVLAAIYFGEDLLNMVLHATQTRRAASGYIEL